MEAAATVKERSYDTLNEERPWAIKDYYETISLYMRKMVWFRYSVGKAVF